MPTRPNIRTLMMQDTIDRQKRQIEQMRETAATGDRLFGLCQRFGWDENCGPVDEWLSRRLQLAHAFSEANLTGGGQ